MEFTVSPVTSAAPQPAARSHAPGNAPARQADVDVLPAGVVEPTNSETEYDEFGRFGAPAVAAGSLPAATAGLQDFQYRWPIEVERRALVPFEAERPNASSEAVTPADETFSTSFAER